MIQTLDVISVNIWQILISLANLVILFLIVKRFLYTPVKRVLAQRRAEIDEQYAKAKEAQEGAERQKEEWDQRIKGAQSEADDILKSAADRAQRREEQIVAEAKAKADGIVRQAQIDASLELGKAREQIKQEIVSVSAALTEKVLEREIDNDTHKELIDSFIDEIGEDDDGAK